MENNPHKKNNDQQIDEQRIQQQITSVYDQWRKQFTSSRKTRDEVTDSLYVLRDSLEALGDSHLVKMAVSKVGQKIAESFTLNLMLKNSILQHITRKGLLRNSKAKPKQVSFSTVAELMAIPWVKLFTELPGFKRFALMQHGLVAIHNNDFELVGYVENEIGMDTIAEVTPEDIMTPPVNPENN